MDKENYAGTLVAASWLTTYAHSRPDSSAGRWRGEDPRMSKGNVSCYFSDFS